MLGFKKNKKESSEGAQGITVGGNSLHHYWLIALLCALIPMLAGFGYLLVLRESGVQDRQINIAAENSARHQAAAIEQMLTQLEQRLEAAAASPLAQSSIDGGDPADLALVEKALLEHFPGAVSLRLIPIGALGTAGLEGDSLGLRNHIEVDLLRRSAGGELTPPESYQVDGSWLTSVARLAQGADPGGRRAVLLLSMDNRVFSEALQGFEGDQGRSSLQQVYRKGSFTRADEIAAVGNGGAEAYRASAELNDGQWSLVFTPSAQLLNDLKISSAPVIIVFAVSLLALVLAFLALLALFQRRLGLDVERISAAADKRTPFEISVPQLLLLAKQLRRTTLRQSARIGAGSRAAAKAGAEDAEEAEAEQARQPRSRPASAGGVDLPAHIFRAYDIRGLADKELTEKVVAQVGRALGTVAGERGQQALIVGSDGRNSSPAIKNVLVKALLDSGRDVIDIGTVPTPLVSFATHKLSTRSAVMVTGSHSPVEYNGLKITLDGAPLAGAELAKLREFAAKGNFSEGAGRLARHDIAAEYLDAIAGDVGLATPLKVVIDAGNGAASEIGPRLLTEIGCDVVPLYCEIDGSFPNHHPDPSVEENLVDLQARVREEGADFGVAFDGDGDRLAVITAEGAIVRTDRLIMLFAQDVVSRNPGADVVFDVKCSRQLAQVVSKNGGRPIMWKTGHALIRTKLMETGALLGGEFSGHIFFGERWFGFDDGMYAAARLAEIMGATGQDLGSLLAEFPDMESTPEILIPIADAEKFGLIKKLNEEADFSPGKVNTLDGVRVDYADGWGLVRASNTGPALTARFEARDNDALERIKQQFREQLAKVAPELEVGF